MRITVVGRHRVERSPELGRLQLSASHTGPDAQRVYDDAVALVRGVTADLERLDAADILESWSVEPVGTSSWEPRDDTGKPLPREHTAQSVITAEFRDPAELAAFSARHGSTPGLSQQGVGWSLTETTRRTLQAEATSGAVVAATERAQVIARASGAGRVHCVAVADPGLLGAGQGASGADEGMVAMAFGGATRKGHDEVDPRPRPVEVSAEVHAVFEADAHPGA